eukprot:CAMPEP_0182471314 /NCGR_PEP_ID=MMETSP1319-20130603/20113_1 /TAXON_ID=172717 /ORGANISM="Bolidomonas pacifica, Strain RCC208" /LENGTH=143 /DNA_ID=CAMNT_0024671857 /DNA_START=133 /DNA_END=561 /DNA_ORIENTATION=-
MMAVSKVSKQRAMLSVLSGFAFSPSVLGSSLFLASLAAFPVPGWGFFFLNTPRPSFTMKSPALSEMCSHSPSTALLTTLRIGQLHATSVTSPPFSPSIGSHRYSLAESTTRYSSFPTGFPSTMSTFPSTSPPSMTLSVPPFLS